LQSGDIAILGEGSNGLGRHPTVVAVKTSPLRPSVSYFSSGAVGKCLANLFNTRRTCVGCQRRRPADRMRRTLSAAAMPFSERLELRSLPLLHRSSARSRQKSLNRFYVFVLAVD
jgi:hypothetical protein